MIILKLLAGVAIMTPILMLCYWIVGRCLWRIVFAIGDAVDRFIEEQRRCQ